MSDFIQLKIAVQKQFDKMSEIGLWRTSVDKDELWDTYLGSFRPEFNPIFRERTVHDCQCCKQFIRSVGNVVSIDADNNLISIWDIDTSVDYQAVANAMAAKVKAHAIDNIFLHYEGSVGTDHNHQQNDDGSITTWDHFHQKLDRKYVKKNADIGSALSIHTGNKEVFMRSMVEISLESAEIVLELIEQGSLYRGDEHKAVIEVFIDYKRRFGDVQYDVMDNYCWQMSGKLGTASRFRNTVIGTLLSDLSDGVDLEKAVKSFESKVAPTNYKRPTALITQTMIKKAQEKVISLGIEESLNRRYAISNDITVNNVLFANRAKKAEGNIFDTLSNEVSINPQKLKKVEEVSIDKFVKDILPKAEVIELLVENKHSGNLMSLIAPMNADSPNLFKWNNGFSWSYNGEVTDSIKARVAKAGGNVNGILRCSLSWFNSDDLDIHIVEPSGGQHIYYGNKGPHRSTGVLDVDMNVNISGSDFSREAVENIVWTDKRKMQEGIYKVSVNNYTYREPIDIGFDVEIEYEGDIHSFHYDRKVNNTVVVAEFEFSQENGIKFINSLPSTQSVRQEWNLNTQQFHKVSMMMHSPNHWDGNETGNKHWFFILDNCQSENDARGFYNEFLSNSLQEHRKVFEVLGSKMKAKYDPDQLSGLGFSSTQRNSVYCKVTGSFNRTVKINF